MAQRRRLRRFPLLARLPRLRRQLPEEDVWPGDSPVVAPGDKDAYPALGDDLNVWAEKLERRFRRLDHRAQILQNQFWRQHVTLIVGGLLATTIGAIQAARGGGIAWLAAIQAVLTGILAGVTVLVRSRRAQHGYLDARLKAERIKSEFYLFLARADVYAGDGRVELLQAHIDDIEAAEGVA